MHKMKFCALNLLFFFTLCARAQSGAQELRVAAASDLTKAFTEIGVAYQRKTGQKVTFIFGSSGMLTKQMENGAPYDLFASANTAYITELEDKGLIQPGSKKEYAQGHIGLWTRKGGPPVPANLRGLLAPLYTKIALANPQFAPYGQAAKEALQAEKLWEPLQPRLVYGENIQQTFQFAASGNAEVGIVSQSQAAGSGGQFRLIPEALYKPLRQALAVLKASRQEASARRFADFVTGPEGQSVLQKYGLALPIRKAMKTKGKP